MTEKNSKKEILAELIKCEKAIKVYETEWGEVRERIEKKQSEIESLNAELRNFRNEIDKNRWDKERIQSDLTSNYISKEAINQKIQTIFEALNYIEEGIGPDFQIQKQAYVLLLKTIANKHIYFQEVM